MDFEEYFKSLTTFIISWFVFFTVKFIIFNKIFIADIHKGWILIVYDELLGSSFVSFEKQKRVLGLSIFGSASLWISL